MYTRFTAKSQLFMITAVCFTHLTSEMLQKLLITEWELTKSAHMHGLPHYSILIYVQLWYVRVSFEHQLEAERGLGFLSLCQLVHLFWIT